MSVSGRRVPPVVLYKQKRFPAALLAAMMVSGIIAAALPAPQAHAAQITTRSLTLQSGSVDSNSDGINDGGSQPAGTVNHLFTFDLPTAGTVGSIQFEYCTTASVATCVTPTGLSTAGITFGGSPGSDVVFTAATSTAANVAYVSRTAASITAGDTAIVQLNSVLNPSPTNYTFFVRISSFASEDATGSAIDTGSVAASTATQIQLTGTMPESLIFCTGGTIPTVSSIPNCAGATSGAIAFDQLFSPSDTATASSQMAASTNASGGYVITVNGPTLTSGSNTIPAMTPATASTVGVGQFGLNLRANTTVFDNQVVPVALGTNVTPANNATNFKGNPRPNYEVDNSFSFLSGDAIAASDDPVAGGTDSQIFTASYIVNVSGSQPAGTYTTTLTYICTPTF